MKNLEVESYLRRENRGKQTTDEIENDLAQRHAQKIFAGLVASWANEETTRTAEVENMNTDTKSRLRQLVHTELRRNHWGDYAQFEAALAAVIKSHPEFSNEKTGLLTEFTNERATRPTPEAFRAEVLGVSKATGLSYDEAFVVVCQRHPSMRSEADFRNAKEDLADSAQAGSEFQKHLDGYFLAHPGSDRKRKGDYDAAWAAVARDHPEVLAAMHVPGRTPANLWQTSDADGKTPPRPAPKVTGRPMPNSPAERAKGF